MNTMVVDPFEVSRAVEAVLGRWPEPGLVMDLVADDERVMTYVLNFGSMASATLDLVRASLCDLLDLDPFDPGILPPPGRSTR